ncbi:MAG: hypothetical protein HY646_21265 [Acidobacteria bacterium]|nr:hypothetical protein [Acidobacteriota bacterium]
MLTKMDLESLREYREGPGRVLSVYLDLDQSNAANLNRGFELALESRLRSIAGRFEEEYEQREFEACATLVREFAYKHRPHSRSLVLFARANGSLYTKELNIPVTTDVRWSESAYIQPFVEAVDKFETYAVVLADKSRARIFTVSLGNIELETEVRKFTPVRHIKTAGTDRMFSQSHFQRKADENASSNLRHVVEVLENVSRSRPFEHVVLAGTTEAIAELFTLLPKEVRPKVISTITMSTSATEKQVLDRTLEIERQAERAFELRRAESLVTSAAKDARAVVGLADTIKALNEKRVRELIYVEGMAARGAVCRICSAAYADEDAECESCAIPASPVDNITEIALSMALAGGATIQQVRGEGAECLKSVGGIGAFLRF